MTQSAARIANVKWNISVPPDFDEATRIYLASQGGKKGALSSLVQKAVSRYIMSSLTGEAKEKVRASGLSQNELDKIIADGIAWAKDHRDESRSVANILISAIISPHNPPDLILQSWLAGDFELLTSEDQLEEIRRVSRYAHLQPFLQAHRVGLLINRIRSLATIVRPGSLISEEALDPDDNFLIAICEAGSANSLVTGDQRAGLLERRHIGATEILTAAQFAERYLGWRVQRS